MKPNFSPRYIQFVLSILLLISISIPSHGQVPPPPPPPNGGTNNGHGVGGNQGTPGAPIGGGLEILLVMGAFYSGKKLFEFRAAKSKAKNEKEIE